MTKEVIVGHESIERVPKQVDIDGLVLFKAKSEKASMLQR